MKRHWFAYFLWILFLLALLGIGVYVLWQSPNLEPSVYEGVEKLSMTGL